MSGFRHHQRRGAGSILLGCLFLLLLLFVANGCASTGGGDDSGSDAPIGPSALAGGKKIGELRIHADPSLEDAVEETIEQFKVVGSLEARLRTSVPTVDMSDSGTLVLDVRIIDMRVRSTGAAIWWGVMAGADYITVSVDVQEGGGSLKTFETGTSTMLGGFAFGGREVRISRMLDELAKRIAARI